MDVELVHTALGPRTERAHTGGGYRNKPKIGVRIKNGVSELRLTSWPILSMQRLRLFPVPRY